MSKEASYQLPSYSDWDEYPHLHTFCPRKTEAEIIMRIDQVAFSCGKEGKGQNWHIRRQQDREGEGRGG